MDSHGEEGLKALCRKGFSVSRPDLNFPGRGRDTNGRVPR